mmetsp:Transcript_1781/g.1902  ORF Transcript_1781/g.1902 Transcript_1781/m.1902 type:complete len:331 (+) Transcript_1781:103-1095(+)
MGGWQKVEDVIGQDASQDWRRKIDVEFSDPAFQRKVVRAMAHGHDPLRGQRALLILGPSASGKSHAMKIAGVRTPYHTGNKNMSFEAWEDKDDFASKVAAIDMPQRALILDGSYIRDASDCWRDMVALAHSHDLDGFSDLFDNFFKPSIGKVKKAVTTSALEGHWNIIVPDTASSFKKTAAMIQRLAESGYSLKVAAVYASTETCTERGKSREKGEGKKYSSKNWVASMQAIVDAQKELKKLGLDDKIQILDNNASMPALDSVDHIVAILNQHVQQSSEKQYVRQSSANTSESQQSEQSEKSRRSCVAVVGALAATVIAVVSLRWLRKPK